MGFLLFLFFIGTQCLFEMTKMEKNNRFFAFFLFFFQFLFGCTFFLIIFAVQIDMSEQQT